MSLDQQPASSDAGAENIVQIPAGEKQGASLADAARALASARHKTRETTTEQRQEAAPVVHEDSAQADNAAPVDEQASGQTEEAIEAESPPIDPPKFWAKEAKERWASLPRETQEYLAQRESERAREVDKVQRETSEQRKVTDTERQRLEQARQQYETALPALMATLEQQQSGEFGDIKSMADVEKLAREDWPRYVMWDAQQKRLAAVRQQVETATQRQSQEKQQKLSEFIGEQAKLFAEKVPEISDKVKAQKLQTDAVKMLQDIGFKDQELGEMWRGDKDLSLHDHRFQLLIRDALLYRDAQAKAKTVTAKSLPPVQRPGTSQPRGVHAAAEIEQLSKRLDQQSTGVNGLRNAAALTKARRAG